MMTIQVQLASRVKLELRLRTFQTIDGFQAYLPNLSGLPPNQYDSIPACVWITRKITAGYVSGGSKISVSDATGYALMRALVCEL